MISSAHPAHGTRQRWNSEAQQTNSSSGWSSRWSASFGSPWSCRGSHVVQCFSRGQRSPQIRLQTGERERHATALCTKHPGNALNQQANNTVSAVFVQVVRSNADFPPKVGPDSGPTGAGLLSEPHSVTSIHVGGHNGLPTCLTTTPPPPLLNTVHSTIKIPNFP